MLHVEIWMKSGRREAWAIPDNEPPPCIKFSKWKGKLYDILMGDEPVEFEPVICNLKTYVTKITGDKLYIYEEQDDAQAVRDERA